MPKLLATLKTTAERTGTAARAVGCALSAFLLGTLALAAFAATFEVRYGLGVLGVAFICFFLLDVVLIARRGRPRGA